MKKVAVAVLVLFGAACAGQPDVDKVPVGQDVAVTKADGGVVEGKITAKDEKTVQVTKGKTTRTIQKDQIADVKTVDATKPAEKPVLPPVAKFREYTIPEGTKITLKLESAVSSGTNKAEDAVSATLAEAVSVDGSEVFPAGSAVKGMVTSAEGSGRVKGLASLALKFMSVTAYDKQWDIDASYSEQAEATKGSDAKKIGAGAGIGAAIGGILGGKGGAAKGAVIGGAAGTGAVVATKGKEVEHAAGTTLTLSLAKAVEVKVPIK